MVSRLEKSGPVILLECTLRDGSYSIDYQFSKEDTETIARALSDAGFRWIEVGHGLGLGASLKGFGQAKEDDIDYIKAGVKGAGKSGAIIGMFFIPGVGVFRDIDEALDAGLGFLRVGTNITEFEISEDAVKYAKSKGLLVSVNLMKSYAVPPSKFADACAMVESFGADMISLVDSAGGMLPDEVGEYASAGLEKISIPLGFHGHNNFHLVVANCLAARKAGARIMDVSIRGMGRSAGNAQTEIMVAVLEKIGETTGIDILKTMDVGEKHVAPLMPAQKGVDDIAVATGVGKFHSGFMPRVRKAVEATGADVRELIMKLGDADVVAPGEELIMDIAHELAKRPRTLQYPHVVKFDDDEDQK